MRTWILMCGGRKRPQNSKVGAESAPTIRTRQNPDERQLYEIVKKRFGKKEPRRQYAALFAYFEDKLGLE